MFLLVLFLELFLMLFLMLFLEEVIGMEEVIGDR